jgi:hypothetical protein
MSARDYTEGLGLVGSLSFTTAARQVDLFPNPLMHRLGFNDTPALGLTMSVKSIHLAQIGVGRELSSDAPRDCM